MNLLLYLKIFIIYKEIFIFREYNFGDLSFYLYIV